jgi:hypothetical protein
MIDEETSETDFNTTALVNAVKEQLDKGIKFADIKEAKEVATCLRRNWAACLELLKSYPDVLNDIAQKLTFSQVRATHIGDLVALEALTVGEQVGMAHLAVIALRCAYCNTLAYQGITDSAPSICPQCKRKALKEVDGESRYDDYSIIYVKELPRNVEAAEEDEIKSLQGKVWRVYYNGVPPNARSVKIFAYVMIKTEGKARKLQRGEGDIEFIAKRVTPIEDEDLAITVTASDHEAWLRHFGDGCNFADVISYQIDPRAIGKELHKEAALLTLHSPLEIHPINSDTVIIRGAMHGAEVGDSKVTKSERMIDIAYGYYHLGEMVIVETSSRTGILYTMNKDNGVILWGVIPNNDRGLVLLDGMQHMGDYEAGEFKETLNQGRLKVNRVVSGERPARVRLIAALNPGRRGEHPTMADYYHRIDAFRDTDAFADPANLTRWDWLVSSATGDVDLAKYNLLTVHERPIPFDVFRKHVLWAWGMRADDITYTDDMKQATIDAANKLNAYRSAKYPLIHNGVQEQVTRFAVAYAVLRHSVDETHKHVVVKAQHVGMAQDFIERMIRAIDYDAFILGVKAETEITEQDMEDINNAITDTHRQILMLLVKKGNNSDAIATAVGLSVSQVRHKYYGDLRRFHLVDTVQGAGARITVKGIQYLKRVTGSKEVEEAQQEGQARLDDEDKTALYCTTATKKEGYSEISYVNPYYYHFKRVSQDSAVITLHYNALSITVDIEPLIYLHASPSGLAHHFPEGGGTGGYSATSSPSQEAAPLLHPPGHSAETPDGKPTYDFKAAEAMHKKAIINLLKKANGGARLGSAAGSWDYLYIQLPDIDKEIIDTAMHQLRYDGTISEPKPGEWHLNGVVE